MHCSESTLTLRSSDTCARCSVLGNSQLKPNLQNLTPNSWRRDTLLVVSPTGSNTCFRTGSNIRSCSSCHPGSCTFTRRIAMTLDMRLVIGSPAFRKRCHSPLGLKRFAADYVYVRMCEGMCMSVSMCMHYRSVN